MRARARKENIKNKHIEFIELFEDGIRYKLKYKKTKLRTEKVENKLKEDQNNDLPSLVVLAIINVFLLKNCNLSTTHIGDMYIENSRKIMNGDY